MLDHRRSDPSDLTLRGLPLADIDQPRADDNVVSAEVQALQLLECFGPLTIWRLERLIMDRGFSAHAAYRAVRLAIIDDVIVYEQNTKLCRLAATAPRGMYAKFLGWLASVFG